MAAAPFLSVVGAVSDGLALSCRSVYRFSKSVSLASDTDAVSFYAVLEIAVSPPSACKWEELPWLKAESFYSLTAFVAIKPALSFRLLFESQISLSAKQTAMLVRRFEACKLLPLRVTFLGGVSGSKGTSAPLDKLNKVQRKKSWNVRTSRSANLQNQRNLSSHIKYEKFEEQVFDKTLVRDLLPKRDLLFISAHNEDAGKFSGTKQDSHGSSVNEPEHSLEDAQARKTRDASPLEMMKTEGFSGRSSVQKLIEYASPAPSQGYEGNYPIRNQTQSREQNTEDPAPFQIIIVLLSGKTWLQWVKPSDLVQSLNSHGSGADLHEHVSPNLTNVRCRGAAHSSKENSERFTACPSEQEPKEPAQNVPSVRVKPSLSKQGSAISAFINEGVNLQQASFQIQIILLTGKTLLLEVQPSLTVRQLSRILEQRLGIPSSLLRLLFVGKQLDNNMPLSFYNIERNATVNLSLRLRGGAVGQSSASKGFSYKDAVHAQPAKESAQSTEAPKPFLVDKMEETPAIEINHPSLDDQHQTFAESALICRFNGLWPCTADLYQWIHSNWTKYCKVFFCSKGFFIVVLAFNEDYQKALTGGPWFWGSAGLFLSPWFPDFDPSTAVISKLPIWVRLPNLPAHLWHFAVFQGIGNTLGRFLATDTSRGETGIYTYGRICAEIDISKGLPDQIILKVGDFHWTQTLDYENTAFRCRHCHQTGHLQNSCAAFLDKKKNLTRKSKSKSWKPCARPPMDDIESSSSDEDDIEAEEENLEHPEDSPSACTKDPSAPLLSQKRTHESSPSGSDKESPPSAQICLQVVPVQPDHNGWVKVSKKKGKKCRLEDSAHAG